MSRLSIKQQFIFLAAVLVATVLLVSGISSYEMSTSEHALKTIYEDRMVPMGQLKKISDAYTVDVVITARKVNHGWLSWELGLAEVERAENEIASEWNAFLKTNINENGLKLVEELKPMIQKANLSVNKLKKVLGNRNQDELQRIRNEEIDVAFQPIHEKLDILIRQQDELTKADYQHEIRDFAAAQRTFLSVSLAAIIFSVLLGFITMRSLSSSIKSMIAQTRKLAAGDLSIRIEADTKNELGLLAHEFNQMADSLQDLVSKVQRSGIQVASSATEIAASIREQQATATEQAATTTEIFASTKEIASTARELVKNMDEVTHVADSTSALAEGGREDLTRMEATMNQMMEATKGIASRLAVLSEKASNINSVVTTINKVADQTNLLSLNAAIEAEKAGEHGIGFGVVATEIRRLADQTAVATWDIEQMVKEMQSAVSSGVMGMEKFSEEVRHGVEQVGQVGDRLSKIVKSVQSLTPHFESVHLAMQGQSAGSGQINQALEQLSQTVQGMAEAMRESVSVVDQLNEASHRLQASVSGFKVSA